MIDNTEVDVNEVSADDQAHNDDGKVSPIDSKNAKPTEQLPSDRMALDKQLKVLAAFGVASAHADGPVSNDDAGEIVDMKAPTIVVTNAFFTELGLLTRVGVGKFNVSQEVREYQQALEWEADDPERKLTPAFKDRWFSRAILSRLKMRDHLPEKQAIAVLAEACGAGPKYRTNLRMLLSFMGAVGLVEIDNGLIRLGPLGSSKASIKSPKEDAKPDQPPDKKDEKTIPDDSPFLYLDASRRTKITLVIEGEAEVTGAQFDRIKKWLELQFFIKDGDGES